MSKEKGNELEEIGGNRIKFIIQMLSNVKNNNIQEMKKNAAFIDQERDNGCKKRIRAIIGQVQVQPVQSIGLTDILNIHENGRWWRVGAAVVVRKRKEEDKKEVADVSPILRDMAKKLRMNTDNKVR